MCNALNNDLATAYCDVTIYSPLKYHSNFNLAFAMNIIWDHRPTFQYRSVSGTVTIACH